MSAHDMTRIPRISRWSSSYTATSPKKPSTTHIITIIINSQRHHSLFFDVPRAWLACLLACFDITITIFPDRSYSFFGDIGRHRENLSFLFMNSFVPPSWIGRWATIFQSCCTAIHPSVDDKHISLLVGVGSPHG